MIKMNQEQNNLNQNNFNIQGNNGIPNPQPFNNQSFNNTFNPNVGQSASVNQQTFNPQPQPVNSFESANANQNFNSNPHNNTEKENAKKTSWKNTTALIIGIVSLVLVFIFQIFTMPLSIAGIVFGALSLKENKKHKNGLILNIISLVIAIPIFILYFSLLKSMPSNPVIGTWDCKAFNNGYNEDLDYIITMKLNNDNQFKWNKYNDENNNYVIGNYEFQDLHKTNNNGTANYYSIILTGDEFVSDGQLQTELYKSQYEMGIIKDADEAILMNVSTYNMYYCYRKDTSSPKIEANYSNDYDVNKESNIKINKLTYTLPANLTEGSMNTDTYKSYSYMNSNSFCQFGVNVYDLYQNLNVNDYFDKYVYDEDKNLSNIYTKKINGTDWHMLDVDGQYSQNKYGVYIDDKTAYGIEFSITDDSKKECENLYNKIIESIKIN